MKFSLKILLLLPGFIFGQNDHLESYIPFDTCKFSSHPILEIKVWVHVLQQSRETPKNITRDSSHFIDEQFQWINKIYSNLKPPSRKNSNNETPYIKDSRIRFLVDTAFKSGLYSWIIWIKLMERIHIPRLNPSILILPIV